MNRSDLVEALNNSGLSQQMSELQRAILLQVTNQILGRHDSPRQNIRVEDVNILNSVGPAAAESAVEFAINHCRERGYYKSIEFNGSIVHNVKLVQNEPEGVPGDGYQNFSSVLRQFLLPRYAYLDFDIMVDPRHMIDVECGYPKFITPIMYRYMYDRDDVARKVVDFYPDESWGTDPLVYETEDETTWTPFELAWQVLCDSYQMKQYLYRLDKLSGVGHYGVLLLGIDDGADLEKPIDEPELLAGLKNSISKTKRNLLYMRPFDEYLSFIHQYETDVMHPRYGLPKFYNLVFLDMTIDAAGASIGTRLNRRVHWSRVIHVADNLHTSLVFGTPRQQPVFNRLLDLRKIKGGSGEMFWKGAFPGYSFEVDPRFVTDEVDFDREKFRKELTEYSDGLRRYLTLLGVSAKSLAPQVADPEKHVRVQEEAISSQLNVPFRIWGGSEEGRLASSQDKLTWNRRLGRRLRMHVEPVLIRNTIERLIALGIMPPPSSGKFYCGWGDLNTTTDEDKANLALKWTQALSQYVSGGVIHFIEPVDYMTLILGLTPRDAMRIDEYIKAQGGYEKLKKVDPSQSGERNGLRTDDAGKESNEQSNSKTPKRDKGDKQTEK